MVSFVPCCRCTSGHDSRRTSPRLVRSLALEGRRRAWGSRSEDWWGGCGAEEEWTLGHRLGTTWPRSTGTTLGRIPSPAAYTAKRASTPGGSQNPGRSYSSAFLRGTRYRGFGILRGRWKLLHKI